jgi:hypothetical protein
VAFIGQGSPLWIMFASGFGFMFVVTQLWGFKLPKAVNIGLGILYLAAVVVLYSGALSGFGPLFAKDFSQIHQVLWIPVTLYLLVPVFILLAALGAWIRKRLRG